MSIFIFRGGPGQCIQGVKEIEVHIGKEVKLSLFAFYMFFFVKNRTESIKKLPELIISYITI